MSTAYELTNLVIDNAEGILIFLAPILLVGALVATLDKIHDLRVARKKRKKAGGL